MTMNKNRDISKEISVFATDPVKQLYPFDGGKGSPPKKWCNNVNRTNNKLNYAEFKHSNVAWFATATMKKKWMKKKSYFACNRTIDVLLK